MIADIVESCAKVTPARSEIHALEAQQLAMPQVEIKVTHHFGHNTYAREIFIPAGTSMTGAIQKFANVNILSAGEITVLTKDGMQRVCAPWTEVTPVGTKRVGYAHTDCVWTTIFSTEDTDVDRIVEHFTTNDEAAFLQFMENLQLKGE